MKPGSYVSFPLLFVALRLAILAQLAPELSRLVLFHGSATATASLVLTEYVFVLLHEQHDEPRMSLFVQHQALRRLVR